MQDFFWWPTLFAYLFGSIPTGVLLAKAMGLSDPRTVGSGNIGAANMARLGGKKMGVLTFIFDFLKGLLPVLLALFFFPDNLNLAYATALLAVVGHCYSLFLRFHGGKGVATTAGAFALLAPIPLAIALFAWALTFLAFRISSLAAMISLVFLLFGLLIFQESLSLQMTALFCCLMVIRRHRSNLEALLKDTERSF